MGKEIFAITYDISYNAKHKHKQTDNHVAIANTLRPAHPLHSLRLMRDNARKVHVAAKQLHLRHIKVYTVSCRPG
jgi:hypothetical protein